MSRFLKRPLSFCLSLFTPQAFPPVPEERKPNSRLQERLLKKLGQHAHPFYFTVSLTEKTSKSEVKDRVCGEMLFHKNGRRCCCGYRVVRLHGQHVIALKLCVGLLLCVCAVHRLHMLYFSAQIPQNLPCSVTLQPGPEDTGKVKYVRTQKHRHAHTHSGVDLCVFIVEQRSWFLSMMKVSDHHGNDPLQ